MVSDKDFKKLCEIDNKMLDNKSVTNEELKERRRIISVINHEVERTILKIEGITL